MRLASFAGTLCVCPFCGFCGNERLALLLRQPQRAALAVRGVRAEAAEVVAFGEAILAVRRRAQRPIVDRQHQPARRRRRLRLDLAFHGLRPPLRLRQLRVGVQDFLKRLRQAVAVP